MAQSPALILIVAAVLYLLSVILSISATANVSWWNFKFNEGIAREGLFRTEACDNSGYYCQSGDTFCSGALVNDVPPSWNVPQSCSQLKAMAGLMVVGCIIGILGIATYVGIWIKGDNQIIFMAGFGTTLLFTLFNFITMCLAATINNSQLFNYLKSTSQVSYGAGFFLNITAWIVGAGVCCLFPLVYKSLQ